MNQHYYIFAWGIDGTITPAIPNDTDPSGFVTYQQGFTFDYQRDLLTDPAAKSPTYTNLNALLSDITTNIQDYQRNGTPEFIDNADNGGSAFSYRINAMVRYSSGGSAPFGLYLNNLDNNTNLPGGTGWVDLAKVIVSSRIRLAGNLNLYVATTGSDSNDGLTSGTPFLTIQHALNIIYDNYDLNGFMVQVNVGSGSFGTGARCAGFPVGATVTATPISIVGNGSGNTTWNAGSGDTFTASLGAQVQLSAMTIKSVAGNGISVIQAAVAGLGADVIFGLCGVNHIGNGAGGKFVSNGEPYSISDSATVGAHIGCSFGGLADVSGSTVTVINSVSFATAFMNANTLGSINAVSMTFAGSGTVTGLKYDATSNAVINTAGGGAGYFPGSVAGSTATGGQYI